MSSDNPTGADNQQERLATSVWLDRISSNVGHYVAGFVDGEGSFNVPIVRERDRILPLRVSLSFNVSQVGPEMPLFLKDVFGVGRIRGRRDGIFYFEITRPDQLEERVFPFFDRFLLRGPKREDLEIFRQITRLVRSGRHLTIEGIEAILRLRAPMNRGGKRRRSDDQIIAMLRGENPQRPYAELPATNGSGMKRWSMPHSDMRKQ
jgi:LAGLIDADG endonuclease